MLYHCWVGDNKGIQPLITVSIYPPKVLWMSCKWGMDVCAYASEKNILAMWKKTELQKLKNVWHTLHNVHPYHCHKPSSEYIWHRSWFAVQPLRPLGWSPLCGKTGIRCRHPSDGRTRVDILCRMCDGMAETLAGDHDHRTDSDISDTWACAHNFRRLSQTLVEIQLNASSA